MSKNIGVFFAVVIVIVMVLVGCSPQTTPAVTTPATTDDSGPLKIGVLLPMTGGAAHWGDQAKYGIETRLDEVARQVAGRTIEVYYEDDNSFNEVMALEKARKLVEVNGVQVLFGPIASSSYLGTDTYIDVKEIPTFAIGYRGELQEWTEPTWNFASNGGLAQITYEAGKWAAQNGYKTATTMGADYETGYQACGAFAEGFTEAGGEIVQMQWAPVGTVDWGPYFSSLQAADLTAVIQYGADMTSYITQFREFGYMNDRQLMLLDTCTVYQNTLAELGDWTEGMLAATDYVWTLDNSVNNNFVTEFEAKAGIKPETMANYGYAAVSFFLKIMEATNGNTDSEAMRNAMLNNMSIDVPSGTFTFLPDKGYSTKDAFVVEAQKDQSGTLSWVVLEKFPQTKNPGYFTKPE